VAVNLIPTRTGVCRDRQLPGVLGGLGFPGVCVSCARKRRYRLPSLGSYLPGLPWGAQRLCGLWRGSETEEKSHGGKSGTSPSPGGPQAWVAGHWESAGRKLGCFPSPPGFPSCPNPRAVGRFAQTSVLLRQSQSETRFLPPLLRHPRPVKATRLLPKRRSRIHVKPWV